MEFLVGENLKYIGLGAVIAALIVSLSNMILQFLRHRAELKLAQLRFAYDQNLAERRFEYERNLAERKFDLESLRNVREKKQQLAEDVLARAYDVKFSIISMRRPCNSEEAETRHRDIGETEFEAVIKDDHYVVLKRFGEEEQDINEFLSRRMRMKAWFGAVSDEPFDIFTRVLNTLVTSSKMILSNPEMADSMVPILKVYGEIDVIEDEVNRAVQILEVICRPILSEPIV